MTVLAQDVSPAEMLLIIAAQTVAALALWLIR